MLYPSCFTTCPKFLISMFALYIFTNSFLWQLLPVCKPPHWQYDPYPSFPYPIQVFLCHTLLRTFHQFRYLHPRTRKETMRGPRTLLRSSGPQPISNPSSTITEEAITMVRSLRNITEIMNNITDPTSTWWHVILSMHSAVERLTRHADFPRGVLYSRYLGWELRGEWARFV